MDIHYFHANQYLIVTTLTCQPRNNPRRGPSPYPQTSLATSTTNSNFRH